MSCLKHQLEIINFCQSCTSFLCSKCPSHIYHVTIDYSLYICQCKSEVESFIKSIQAKEKMLEMLEAKIKGYFTAISVNKQICIETLKKSVDSVRLSLESRHKLLLQEIEELTEKFIKPLMLNSERVEAYLLKVKELVVSAENIIEDLGSMKPKDPVALISNMKNLNTNESHYIDTFIKSCKTSLEAKVPIIPIVETFTNQVEQCVYLNYNSQQLEIKPLFPYWNLERLLSSLKIKNQGSAISSTTDTWATALFKDDFSCGKASIEFLINKDASGSKLYIGVVSSTTPVINLCKAFSSNSGHPIWSYRICGEMHSKGFVYSNLKDKRRFRRGDRIRMDIDLERMIVMFIKNDEEMYTFVDVAERLTAFVSFGEAFQTVQVTSCDTINPKVIFH